MNDKNFEKEVNDCIDSLMRFIEKKYINDLKDLIKMQTETIKTINENITLLRRSSEELHYRTRDINERLVEMEDWKFEEFRET